MYYYDNGRRDVMGFSDRFKEAMELRHYRQVDIVNKTKIDKGTISNYLSGKYEPKALNAKLIADALDVNLPWLLGYEDVPMEVDQYVEYSVPEQGGYTVFEFDKDFDADITKEKWMEMYDSIMAMPEPLKIEVLKYVKLSAVMADMQRKRQGNL